MMKSCVTTMKSDEINMNNYFKVAERQQYMQRCFVHR